MLSRIYLIYLTKTFGSINKIFGRVKKTIQAKTLVDLSKRVSLTELKFGRLNQNILWNQPNTVNQTILLDEPIFFWVYGGTYPTVRLLDCQNLIVCTSAGIWKFRAYALSVIWTFRVCELQVYKLSVIWDPRFVLIYQLFNSTGKEIESKYQVINNAKIFSQFVTVIHRHIKCLTLINDLISPWLR